MTYAPDHRPFYDADSHVMEYPTFITDYADPEFRDRIPEVDYTASIVTDEEVAEIVNNGNRHSQAHIQAQIDLGDELIAKSKEIQALGAFNRDDRKVAVDMLGFKKQLVFATHSAKVCFSKSKSVDPALRYAATRAHNRAMSEFCEDDSRLMAVGVVPLHEPELAIKEIDFLVEKDMQAAWVPHYASGGRSPGHVDLDPFWQKLVEHDLPFVMHIGGSPLETDPAWNNNGLPAVKDWTGGGENVRAKDMAMLHHPIETFVSMLVLDGVFERFPALRGASVELGAAWVPTLLDRMDQVVGIWKRMDDNLKKITRKPSEQLTSQMAFTPFVYEDVGKFINYSNPELYLFSSDYPHVEGGKDPIGRFEKSLDAAEVSDSTKDLFYAENFLRIFPDARVSDERQTA